jgi:hypothetical protein
MDTIETENGWMFESSAATVKSDTITDPFGDVSSATGKVRKYSGITYSITLFRTHPRLLFAKLLLGMYVAFLVAYIALFLDIKSSARIELPVGGLFAAIANKYIIESILPQSPQFTLVDKLHSVTIISILAILVYTVVWLFLRRQNEKKHGSPELLNKYNKAMVILFTLVYIGLNLSFILNAYYQQ